MQKFDAIVVGGGPGGYECAIRLSQNGLKTALVEEAELGGTCLNRGCIPTKTLLHSADIYHDAKNGAPFGVSADNVTFDYAKIIERKNAVSKQLSNGVAFLEKSHGVTVFADHATLTDRQTVHLAGGEDLTCDHLIVATGSSPARIPIPGVDLPGVVDSTGLLNMTTCPKHIIIVGGGVIGVEFATFFYRLGVPVTIVEMLDRLLGPLDKDVTSFVEAELKSCGVELVLGVKVESIEDGLKVHYASVKDGAKGTVEGDVVLMAGGRAPNTRGIGLDTIGVKMDRKGFVEVDGLCRTNVPGVYAIGDINGKMQLAHVASAQGLLVALTMGENKGFAKFVYDKATDEILGFHIIGPRATDLAAEVAAVMECEGTVAEIGRTVHPHPTVSEVVMEAAHVCHSTCVNAPKPRR